MVGRVGWGGGRRMRRGKKRDNGGIRTGHREKLAHQRSIKQAMSCIFHLNEKKLVKNMTTCLSAGKTLCFVLCDETSTRTHRIAVVGARLFSLASTCN